MPEHEIVRFGIRYGKFVLVYERIVKKLKPVKQIEDKDIKQQLTTGGIDTYA